MKENKQANLSMAAKRTHHRTARHTHHRKGTYSLKTTKELRRGIHMRLDGILKNGGNFSRFNDCRPNSNIWVTGRYPNVYVGILPQKPVNSVMADWVDSDTYQTLRNVHRPVKKTPRQTVSSEPRPKGPLWIAIAAVTIGLTAVGVIRRHRPQLPDSIQNSVFK